MIAFLPLVLAINVLIAPRAWGQNAPGSTPSSAESGRSAPAALSSDLRLDAPRTVVVRNQPLGKLIQSLHPVNGPSMRVGPDIAWERVTVYAKKQPSSLVMASLRSLLNYAWVRDDSASTPQWYSFVLAQRTREYEADLRRQMLERTATSLFQLTDYLKTPADEFIQQRHALEVRGEQPQDSLLNNANLNYLSDEHSRQALEMLTTLDSTQRESLLRDGDYLLTWNEMGPHQRELALGLAAFIQNDPYRHVLKAHANQDDLTWVKSFGLLLYVECNRVTGAVTGFSYGLGGQRYVAAQVAQDLPLHDLFAVRGNPYRSRYGMHLPIYPRLEVQRFPADFKLDSKQVTPWSNILEELSRHITLPIYSDSYSFLPTPQERSHLSMPDMQNCTLVAGLDRLCNWYRYLWWYQDGALYFRSRTWFEDRLYEVPSPVIALLQRKLGSGGTLDIEALDALSSLTLPQLQGLNAQLAADMNDLNLVQSDEGSYDIMRSTYSSYGAYDCLQVYAKLEPKQKDRVLTAEGVPLTEMAPEQRDAFFRAWVRDNSSGFRMAGGDPARLRLHATQIKVRPNVSAEGALQSGSKQKMIYELKFDELAGTVQIAYDPHDRSGSGRR